GEADRCRSLPGWPRANGGSDGRARTAARLLLLAVSNPWVSSKEYSVSPAVHACLHRSRRAEPDGIQAVQALTERVCSKCLRTKEMHDRDAVFLPVLRGTAPSIDFWSEVCIGLISRQPSEVPDGTPLRAVILFR